MEDRRQGENFATIRKDLISHSGSIGALIEEQRRIGDILNDFKMDRAVRKERDTHLHQRLDRIEESIEHLTANTQKSIDAFWSIGKWLVLTFSGTFLIALATFIIKGGLSIIQ